MKSGWQIAMFFAAGDLGTEGLIVLGLFALLVIVMGSALLISVLNWLAKKSGERVSNGKAEKESRENSDAEY